MIEKNLSSVNLDILSSEPKEPKILSSLIEDLELLDKPEAPKKIYRKKKAQQIEMANLEPHDQERAHKNYEFTHL